jgi:hypothetical protein
MASEAFLEKLFAASWILVRIINLLPLSTSDINKPPSAQTKMGRGA